MVHIEGTDRFSEWLRSLKDGRARTKIVARIDRMRFGNFGDVAPVGHGVSELRLRYGPGYRVYFVQRGRTLVILLCGGAKDSQQADIKLAHEMAEEF